MERFRDLYGLAVDVDAPKDVRFANEAVPDLLFSLVRECVFNVVTHAGTSHARIGILRHEAHVDLHVSDEGRGFDPTRIQQVSGDAKDLGLRCASERLALFGGKLHIDSQYGGGTRVSVELPTDELDDASQNEVTPAW